MSDFGYGTGKAVGMDIFDTSTTGASFYNDLIPGSPENEYMADTKNLKGEIRMVSPYEYFNGCAKIFSNSNKNITAEQQIDFIKKYESDKIDELKKVITEKKRKFPMTYLNYAERGQEGRHRMYVAGELFGWNKKFPVLVINWADENRQNKWLEQKRQYNIEEKIDNAISETKRYRYDAIEDAREELEWQLEIVNNKLEEYEEGKIVYDIKNDYDTIYAKITDDKNVLYERTIGIDDLRIEPSEEIDDELSKYDDLSDDELDDITKELLRI